MRALLLERAGALKSQKSWADDDDAGCAFSSLSLALCQLTFDPVLISHRARPFICCDSRFQALPRCPALSAGLKGRRSATVAVEQGPFVSIAMPDLSNKRQGQFTPLP